jgi:membrane protein DedA with SNARE-associated domain/rhodanese-related sulfurtransferase
MEVLTQFLLQHGYTILFMGVLAEQIGLPFPSSPLLMAAGAFLGTHGLRSTAVLAAATVASLLSDSVWYWLGRRRGSAILGHVCKVALEPETCVSRMHRVYARHGAGSLLFCKFIPGLGTLGPAMAGMVALAPWKFLLLDAGGALAWSGAFVTAGWVFRTQLDDLIAGMAKFSAWFGVAVGLGLASYVAVKYIQRRRIYRALRIARISPAELKERMDARENLIILDLRSPEERRQGQIPGSLQFEQDKLNSMAPKFVDAEVILYCSSLNEAASARVALRLKRQGFMHVRPLEGGFPRWRSLGFPVVRAAAQTGRA